MKAKEVNYFDMFVDAAKVCLKAAEELEKLVKNKANNEKDIVLLHDIEHEGDELYHKLYYHLNRSFITPIEREDILEIARYIEKTIDIIDEVGMMYNVLSINTVKDDAIVLSKLIIKSCKALLDATVEFKNFKKSKQLSQLIVEINHIEEDGDRLYEDAVKTLFNKETNVLEVIKWKNIYDAMENVLDSVEDVAEIMEGVIVKNS